MPMQSLPEDIFIEIVETFVLPHNDLRAPRLTTLRLVCRRWDELIQQTPSLWTFIWNGTNNTYVERALQRSGTLGLKVRVSYWSKVKNRDKERFWSAVLPHLDRWEHAELSGKRMDSIPLALALKGASRLRSLAVDSNSRKYENIYGPFSWPLPNLETLRIQHFNVPWSTEQDQLARLKYLYINLAYRGGFPNSPLLFTQLFDTLRGCKELVSLHLTGICFSSNIPKEKPAPFSLPNLEVISLCLPRSVDCRLLETIHTPKCRLIVIRAGYGAPSMDQLLEALENLAGRIGTAKIPNYSIVEAQELYWEAYVGCELRAVDGSDRYMRLRLEVTGDRPLDEVLQKSIPFFHRWVRSFGPSTGWGIRVTSYIPRFVTSGLSAFAQHFPTAQMLTITNPSTSRILVDPLLALYGPVEPAFPCLEQLELWYCKAFAGEIIRIITNRVIREDTLTPLRMRIKLPKDMDEVERVELAWLEDQLPTLTIQETPVLLGE